MLLRLAEKAFRPLPLPFPVLHVDTGHNFPEVIEFRDRRLLEAGHRLIVASVQASIDTGRVTEEAPGGSRNRLQTVTLLDALEEHGFDAAFGGARRDEERARAKERVLSFRDEFGQWEPRAQRAEPWTLYNARIRRGEHIRVFPLSNWTELDVWRYIEAEELELPSIYFAHRRRVLERDGHPARRIGVDQAARDRAGRGGDGPLSHGRRPDGHRRGALRGSRHPDGDRRDRDGDRLRARRDEGRRSDLGGGDGGPKAGGLLLMAAVQLTRPARAAAAGHGRVGRRRQEHADRPSAAGHRFAARRSPGRCLARGSAGSRGGHRRSARRARAGHHDRRRLPVLLDRRGDRSSSPTPRVTSATRATCSPAHRPRTSRWC